MIDYNVASGIVTLTTDFGLSGYYVGVMKGVIASIFPQASLIDISHETPSHGIGEAAFAVAQAYRWFPPGTVHLVVVDPGVGSARRPLAASCGGHFFTAPDNGLLSQVFEGKKARVRVIDAERWARKPISRTFHGRDVFAPAAARLARGEPFDGIGPEISDHVLLEPATPVLVEPGHWRGRVLNVDRFGNIVTSFPIELLKPATAFRLTAGRLEAHRLLDAYADAGDAEPFVIAGSSGYLEVSINRTSAADSAGIGVPGQVDLYLNGPDSK